MRKILLLFSVFLLSSCTTYYVDDKYVCNCQEKEKVQEFVQTSIKNANNMSDEEMEDVIRELRLTAIKTICNKRQIYMINDNENHRVDWEKTKLDSCESIMDEY